MNTGWMVIRNERHIDDKYWVCLSRDDALQIAHDVTEYWKDNYSENPSDVAENLYGNLIFNYDKEECFSVVVFPQVIRGEGETEPIHEEVEA